MARGVWASVMAGDPKGMKSINKRLAWFWAVQVVPITVLYFLMDPDEFVRTMALYLAIASIWANVAGHWSTAQAANVEIKQDEAAAKADSADPTY